jgi:hypothetical protein
MTHTLHRLGNTENLSDDFVVFAMSAKGLNEVGSASGLKQFLKIALEYDPMNVGDMKTGNILKTSKEDLFENIQDVSIVHAVYNDEKKVAALLKQVKEADLGVSVVVSGLIEKVKHIGGSVDVKQHTIECSAGIWGKMEKLPSPEVLQVTTMCGHGMVAANLVTDYVRQIKRGKITAADAARKLAEPCVCGVFNYDRAEKILNLMVESNSALPVMEQGQTSVPEYSK